MDVANVDWDEGIGGAEEGDYVGAACDGAEEEGGGEGSVDVVEGGGGERDTSTIPSCRHLFKKADWTRIPATVADEIGQVPRTIADDEIDNHATRLASAVEAAIRLHVPLAKPSPYAKRWWTHDLTQQRNDYTHWRSRARAARRAGFTDHQMERRSKDAKQTCTSQWTSNGGRLLRLGDSAHAFFPSTGNGAVQALEDSVSLGECLRIAGRKGVQQATKIHNKLR